MLLRLEQIALASGAPWGPLALLGDGRDIWGLQGIPKILDPQRVREFEIYTWPEDQKMVRASLGALGGLGGLLGDKTRKQHTRNQKCQVALGFFLMSSA